MNLNATNFVFFPLQILSFHEKCEWPNRHKTSKPRDEFQTAGNAGYFFMSEPLDGAYRGKYITVNKKNNTLNYVNYVCVLPGTGNILLGDSVKSSVTVTEVSSICDNAP